MENIVSFVPEPSVSALRCASNRQTTSIWRSLISARWWWSRGRDASGMRVDACVSAFAAGALLDGGSSTRAARAAARSRTKQVLHGEPTARLTSTLSGAEGFVLDVRLQDSRPYRMTTWHARKAGMPDGLHVRSGRAAGLLPSSSAARDLVSGLMLCDSSLREQPRVTRRSRDARRGAVL